jgi:hypothetical protein
LQPWGIEEKRKKRLARRWSERYQPRAPYGALAQLVERFNGIEEVSGSTPLCSTILLFGDGLENRENDAGCVRFSVSSFWPIAGL